MVAVIEISLSRGERLLESRHNEPIMSGRSSRSTSSSDGAPLKMASRTTLNAISLEALGARRLAEMLMEIAEGDAATRRRLRLELAAPSARDFGGELRKRITLIGRSRSFAQGARSCCRSRSAAPRDCGASREERCRRGTEFDVAILGSR